MSDAEKNLSIVHGTTVRRIHKRKYNNWFPFIFYFFFILDNKETPFGKELMRFFLSPT